MEILLQDARYGVRALLRGRPLFSLLIVATVAFGIGATTALFSVVNAVLLRPLPFGDPDRLVYIESAPMTTDMNAFPNAYLDWADEIRTLSGVASFFEPGGVNLSGTGAPLRVGAAEVTPDLFDVLGVRPARGRDFQSEESRSEDIRPAMISEELWAGRFGADPEIVGQQVTLNGRAFTVIGVVPAQMSVPRNVDVWITIELGSDRIMKGPIAHNVVARMAPGISLEQVQSELDALAAALNLPPGVDAPTAVPIRTRFTRRVRTSLLVLLGAVGFVLLVVCANVANLLLARAATRRHEMEVRAALGAGTGRLLRQVLTESILLATLGGALGILLAVWGTDLLIALAPTDVPRIAEAGIDSRVLVFSLAITAAVGILFGLAPALRSSRASGRQALAEAGRVHGVRGQSRMLGNVLVVSQIGLSLALLIGSALLIKSLIRLQRLDLGFDPADVVTLSVFLPPANYPDAAATGAYFTEALERIRSLPGVSAAGAINFLPLGGGLVTAGGYQIEGIASEELGSRPFAIDAVVTPGYFAAMGIPLLAGRRFDERDRAEGARTVIIDETMARTYWPDRSPLGARMTLHGEDEPREVVGVVGSTFIQWLLFEPWKATYVPYAQTRRDPATFAIRADRPPDALLPDVRRELAAIDPSLPLYDVRTMQSWVAGQMAGNRFNTIVLTAFGIVGLVLASLGIYGVLSYSVVQRRREIAVRVALGARREDIVRMVLRRGGRMMVLGLTLGTGTALALSRLLSSLLFEVSPLDPAMLALAIACSMGAALSASYLPARRAAETDPMQVLRE